MADRDDKTAKGLSRRGFLGEAGKLVAGAAAGATAIGVLTRPASAEETVPTWPWPYKKLDPQKVYERGRESYYKWGCCEAAYEAVTGELGSPFTVVPRQMFKWGEGGVAGWGNLCGALNGSCAAIALVHGDDPVTNQMINDLLTWYQEVHGSGTTLCHSSVSGWCDKTGNKAESQERKDRCAHVAGDAAASAAELLNRQADGQYKQTSVLSESVNGCMTCHGKTGLENTRGKMECTSGCHDEPHP